MKTIFDYWMKLSLRVILLFATAMLVSFSPEYLRSFFNDTKLVPNQFGDIFGGGMVDDLYKWGFRHYLYFWMCVALFIIQIVRIFAWVNKNEKNFTI